MKTRIFAMVAAALFVLPMITFGQTETKEKPKKVEEIKIQTNLHCGSCKEKIEAELATVKGVKEAVADVDTKVVTVKFSPKKTSADVIVERIQKLGYQAKTIGGCCPGHGSGSGCSGAGKTETGGCKGSGSGSGSGSGTGCGGKH
ncbi:MAG TPA: heavy metal-associated domain-containing protein [Bacteroidales bacterium]|nr:heavy metal-associated domain-containing protein [Bacteroidales bacterium]